MRLALREAPWLRWAFISCNWRRRTRSYYTGRDGSMKAQRVLRFFGLRSDAAVQQASDSRQAYFPIESENRYKKSPDRLAKACKDVKTGAFADASLGVIIILAESHSLHNL